jgi:hypothetical protein
MRAKKEVRAVVPEVQGLDDPAMAVVRARLKGLGFSLEYHPERENYFSVVTAEGTELWSCRARHVLAAIARTVEYERARPTSGRSAGGVGAAIRADEDA